jgi:hypothetical protein
VLALEVPHAHILAFAVLEHPDRLVVIVPIPIQASFVKPQRLFLEGLEQNRHRLRVVDTVEEKEVSPAVPRIY